MDLATYNSIKQRVVDAGYAKEIEWARTVKPCRDPIVFFEEYVWVIVNSGMKNQVARTIYDRIFKAIGAKKPIKSAFGHPGKTWAIEYMMENYTNKFDEYRKTADADKLAFLETLPWIGPITKYHLAKNLGMNTCKPDRHLVRIAGASGTTPNDLCRYLSRESGDRVGVVDVVLWRAANLRMI